VGALSSHCFGNVFNPTHVWFEWAHRGDVTDGGDPIGANHSYRANPSASQTNGNMCGHSIMASDSDDALRSSRQDLVGSPTRAVRSGKGLTLVSEPITPKSR
jgi:hypothetical protein